MKISETDKVNKETKGFIGGRVIALVLVIIGLVVSLGCLAYWLVSPMYGDAIDIVDKPTISDTDVELPETNIELPEVDDNIEEVVTEPENIYKEEQKADEIINILLCGMDARNYDTRSRSDTMILASYNKTKDEVKLISFMRDGWVMLPDRGWSRINAATAYGGTGLLINTINHNFDLDIQNYIEIKFSDFEKVIDILGGVEVSLTAQEVKYINNKLHTESFDWNNDIKEKAGVINLNGKQALWHCRNRTVGNGDFDRTERQRDVLTAIIKKAMTMNLTQATQVVMELREHVNTNVPLDVILDICTDALLSGDVKIETTRIPFDNTYSYANKNGASVITFNIEQNTEQLHELLGYTDTEDTEDTEGSAQNIE